MTSQWGINSSLERNSYSKHLWLFDVIHKSADGVFTELEMSVDQKMVLRKLVPIINVGLKELVPESSVDCGFKVYKMLKR
jgi:hypothetical protein